MAAVPRDVKVALFVGSGLLVGVNVFGMVWLAMFGDVRAFATAVAIDAFVVAAGGLWLAARRLWPGEPQTPAQPPTRDVDD